MKGQNKKYVVTIDLSLSLLIPVEAGSEEQAATLGEAQLETALASCRLGCFPIISHTIDLVQAEEVRS